MIISKTLTKQSTIRKFRNRQCDIIIIDNSTNILQLFCRTIDFQHETCYNTLITLNFYIFLEEKMKKFTKILLLVLAFVLISVVLALTAFAAETSGDCGTVSSVVKYSYSNGVLRITGTGQMCSFSNEYPPPWKGLYIETVIVSDGVTGIGSNAFSGSSHLKNVVLGKDVGHIYDGAFRYCRSLETVTHSELYYIGDYAFSNCTSLKNINFESFVYVRPYSFYNCSSLTSAVFSDRILYIGGYAFAYCSSLNEISFPGVHYWDDGQEYVTIIYENTFKSTAYYNDISNWENGKVLYISNYLVEVKADLSGSYIIKDGTAGIAEHAFRNCDNLSGLFIPDSVALIYYPGWKNLKEIKFSTKIAMGLDGSYANLAEKVVITPSSDSYTFPDGSSWHGNTVNQNSFISEKNIKTVIMEEGIEHIEYSAFARCSGIENVIFPESLKSIGNNAFYGCSEITKIVIPENVTNIGFYAFDGCSKLESVLFWSKNIDFKSEVFRNCPNLSTVYLFKNSTADTYFSSEEYIKIYLDEGCLTAYCNGTDIIRNFAQINREAKLVADIKISAISKNLIKKYQLIQNDTVLAESESGSFSISNDKFIKGASIKVAVVDHEGESTMYHLNIDIVSFDYTATSFPIISDIIKVQEWADDVFGGCKFNFGNDGPIDITFEVNNTELKVGFNEKVEDKDLSELNEDLRDWLNEKQKIESSSSISFSIGGYAVFEIGNLGPKSSKCMVIMFAKYKDEFGKQFVAWGIPLRLEFEFSAEGNFQITEIGYDEELGQIILPEVNSSMGMDVTARLGAGVKQASIGVYGNLLAEIGMKVIPDFSVNSIVARGELGLYCKVAGFGEGMVPVINGERVLYPASPQNLMLKNFDMLYYEENYSAPVSNRQASEWNFTDEGVLQTGVSQSADPQIVGFADYNTLMVYIDEDENGITKLKYSEFVIDHEQEISGWSTPLDVEHINNTVFEFDVYNDWGDIWLVYTAAKCDVSDLEDFSEIASKAEVYVSKFDMESHAFGEPVRITDNDFYEKNLSFMLMDGYYTVAYVENTDNHFLGMTENNSVYISRLYDNEWSEPSKIIENCNAVTDLELCTIGYWDYIALIEDTDSNFATENDSVLILCNSDGITKRIDEGNISNLKNLNYILYWYKDGAVYSLDDIDEAYSFVTNIEGASDFEIVDDYEKLSIIYRVYNSEGEMGGCDIWTRFNYEGVWSNPIRLTEESGLFADGFSACGNLGVVLLVSRFTGVSFTENDFELDSRLNSYVCLPISRLEIKEIKHERLFNGAAVEMHIYVENKGLSFAYGFDLTVDDSTQNIDMVIAPGEIVVVDYLYTVNDYVNPTVTVVDENSNTSERVVEIFCFDAAVDAKLSIENDKCFIRVTAINEGQLSGSGVLNIRLGDANGKVIYSEKLYLSASSSFVVKHNVDKIDAQKLYVEFVPNEQDDDNFSLNNFTVLELREPKESAKIVYGDVNSDGAIDVKDVVLFAQYLAGWDVSLDLDAADCNNDGETNIKDIVLLAQHLAGWNVTLG